MVEVTKIMVTSFKRSHACTGALSVSKPEAGHCRPTPLPETPGHSWACLDQFLVGSLLLSPGSWCAQGFVCALQEFISQSCKFWQLCGGVNGDLLQEGLCHTQVCCTQSPCPCSRPLLWYFHRRHSDTILAQSLWVGRAFCALPGSEQLRQPGAWQVHCPRWAMHLSHLRGPGCSVLQVPHESTVSGVLCVSSGELISGCDPPGRCQPPRISGRCG